ncbi:Irregular chiasm C-roughest protein [Papilio xuthus]|uniref:Irregular chiasm C-roughest protein n=1 Tax=Papilio xuthus TaxID=66420 RepID=A0A194QMX1_PAPXU|nr:Irregular chiasm C-roughest protein [Papilio xuthus]
MADYKSRLRVTSRCVQPLFLLLRTKLSYLVLLTVFGVTSGFVEQKFAMEPQDQTAVVGSRVILPCRVENKVGQLQWTKDDFGLGLHRDLSGYDRYKMIGSDEEGDYSLDIREVTLEDDAKYQCQVSSGLRGPGFESQYAPMCFTISDVSTVKENIVMLHISAKKFKDMCEVNPHLASVVYYGLVTPNLGYVFVCYNVSPKRQYGSRWAANESESVPVVPSRCVGGTEGFNGYASAMEENPT